MKKILVLFFLMIFAHTAFSQTFRDVTETEPANFNDLELGITISNFRKQQVKGVDHDRYELVVYARNKRNGDIAVRFTGNETARDLTTDRFELAQFICQNATGDRLTSREATLRLREHRIRVNQNNVNTEVLAGYFLGRDEAVQTTIIIIVPEGQKPIIKARANF